jgi:serine/threonine protein kinase
MNLQEGSIIAGKYEFVRELGEGGIGRVLLVRHRDLGVEYALKLLHRLHSENEKFIENFKQEASILLKFSHPGSVQLRDFGRTENGHYYMAMDYCEGQRLSDVIAQHGPFSVEEALELIQQVLAVLEASHLLGIVHRDIKPDNIMFLRSARGTPQIKVLDFGVATLKERITISGGGTFGTPEYVSPEIALGEAGPDHRVDIYASGILLHELLCGRVPFRGATVVETLLCQVIQPLDPLPAELQIPLIVDELIAKALHKEASQRYNNANEFRDACRETLRTLRQGSFDYLASGAASTQPAIVRMRSTEAKELIERATKKNNYKILCLDEDEMIVNVVRFIFEKEGFKLFTSQSFSSIHRYLFEEQVDLMLTDVAMPGMSGEKLCQMIKQSIPRVKIVLFSHREDEELKNLCELYGADGWLNKSAKPEEWIKRIQEIKKAPSKGEAISKKLP